MILLRSLVFNSWFFGATFAWGLLGAFVRWLAPRHALVIARLWARTVIGGARVICGIEVAVTGLDRLPPGAVLVASQHQSAFDTLIWVVLLPRVSYIFKAELARIPLFGPMLVASGQIPIDREASVGAVRALLRATQRAREEGRQIVIFPEGTRVTRGAESSIRGGFTLVAGRTRLPIYPVATDSGRLWGRRSFRKFPGLVHIVIGEPIMPDLPPGQLVAALKRHWNNALPADSPVHNSVDRLADSAAEAGPPGP